MWGKIWGLVEVLRALIKLYKEWQAWREAERIKDEAKKRAELEKALNDAEKATTPEEAFDAQERVIRSSSN